VDRELCVGGGERLPVVEGHPGAKDEANLGAAPSAGGDAKRLGEPGLVAARIVMKEGLEDSVLGDLEHLAVGPAFGAERIEARWVGGDLDAERVGAIVVAAAAGRS